MPDGDTGTNMSMTLAAAADRIFAQPDVTLTKAADVAASGAVARCARQLGRHPLAAVPRLFQALKGMEQADGRDFAAALTAGVEGRL